MSKAFVSSYRAWLVSGAVAFAFCVLIGRLFYLHVWAQDELLAFVEGNRKMVQVVEARRGNIIDRRGNLLATTHTTINLGVDPQSFDVEDRPKLVELAALIGRPLEELEAAVDRTTRQVGESKEVKLIKWASLAKGISEDVYEQVQALKIKGVYGNRQYTRTYPGGQLAAHLLGYVNKEGTPATGVENFFDYYLRGQDGWRETERDGRRREMAQFREREVEPTDGLSVELSIDQMVQHIVESEVDRLADEYNPDSISILVSEPGTGYLLALANYPSYDPNEFYDIKKYPMETRRNRALTDVIEPGSTFKIVAAGGVLNEGMVHPEDEFQTGKALVSYRGRTVKLPRDHKTHESMTAHEVVMKSSNRGAAQFGMLLGEHRLYDYAQLFGFGENSGIDLGGEVDGTLHPVKSWDGLTITRLPMGHAVSATPIQIHYAMSVVANDGVLMKPQLVKRVYDRSGGDVVRFHPQPKRRAISAEAADQLSTMLVDVVSKKGTARQAMIENFNVAGKTGTTQKIVNGKYSHSQHVASFSGYFPADNPALVITVIVDHPKFNGLGYGGSVAGPAFRNIAEACIAYLGIRPSKPDASSIALRESFYDRSRRLSN